MTTSQCTNFRIVNLFWAHFTHDLSIFRFNFWFFFLIKHFFLFFHKLLEFLICLLLFEGFLISFFLILLLQHFYQLHCLFIYFFDFWIFCWLGDAWIGSPHPFLFQISTIAIDLSNQHHCLFIELCHQFLILHARLHASNHIRGLYKDFNIIRCWNNLTTNSLIHFLQILFE